MDPQSVKQPGAEPPKLPPPEDRCRPNKEYRDIVWAVLWVIHLVMVLALLIIGSGKEFPKDEEINTESNTHNNDSDGSYGEIGLTDKQRDTMLLTILSSCGVAMVFAVVWLIIMQKFAKQLIYFTLLAAPVICTLLALIMIYLGIIEGAITMAIVVAISMYIYIISRPRIPFSTKVLQTCVSVTQKYTGMIWTSVISLFVTIIWIVLWILAVIQLAKFDKGMQNPIAFFMILSFYWTLPLIKNVCHVTYCGTMATWYFFAGTESGVQQPVSRSLKRATTTSFGSVCFGSLLIAIMEMLRSMFEKAQRGSGGFIACCVLLVFSCMQEILEMFTKYAFVHVAVYGVPFCEAGKMTWDLIKSSGVDGIINDLLITRVLNLGGILGGIVCAIYAGLVSYDALKDEIVWCIVCILVAFIVGIVLVRLVMTVVDSCSACLFVCYAEASDVLEANQPELATEFREAHDKITQRSTPV